jgi:hypothetical protein
LMSPFFVQRGNPFVFLSDTTMVIRRQTSNKASRYSADWRSGRDTDR